MKIISIWIALFLTIDVFAGAGVFPQGDSIKMIKNKLKFKAGEYIGLLSADPTLSATDAPSGSLGIFGSVLYVKQDEGSSTNWLNLTPTGVPFMGKGSILTSNGVANGEFTACADGEILEWDAAEAAGVKCVAKPVSSTSGYIVESGLTVQNLGVTGTQVLFSFSNVTLEAASFYTLEPIINNAAGLGASNWCMLQLSNDADNTATATLVLSATDATLTNYSKSQFWIGVYTTTGDTRNRDFASPMIWYNSQGGEWDSLSFSINQGSLTEDWATFDQYNCRFGIRKL